MTPNPLTDLSWQGWFTITVVIVMLVALVKEVRPPDIVMAVAAGILAVGGAITPKQLLVGFSNDVIVTIALLCVIVRTWEVNGLMEIFSTHVLPKTNNYPKQLAMIMGAVSALSAFMNNTVIVLMMTPALRRWALKKHLSPSKFLIPLSYASIVGGMCTLIGTSTNLIIDGLMRQINPNAGFTFFEIGKVGLPAVFMTIGMMILIGKRFLPDRVDVASAIAEDTREFTAEFIVEEDSPLINKQIFEVSGKYFKGELLVEIERNQRKILSPSPYEYIQKEDRLIFAGDIHQIAELHTVRGLTSAADPHFELDESSSHYSEVVITTNSFLIGKTLKKVNFRNIYGASVLAVYRDGRRILGNVGDIVLDGGDTLILLSSDEWHAENFQRDFYSIRHNEKLTIFHPVRASLVLAIAIGMVLLAAAGVPIFIAVLAATLLYLFTKCISFREAGNSIIWNVLLLIASSFAIAKAVETTGVATFFAKMLLSVLGSNPYMLIGGILLVVSLFTEIISNNSAALLLFPIALKVTQLAGFNGLETLKAVGVTVAVGSSCAFGLPTGYQTHMIIYGPGGYRLMDFVKNGVVINIAMIILGTILIPYFWPLN